ncbi:MAG: competence protein ComEC family protein [Candidatus Omnitrophica bacterium]|nr:competence protein ComEC family protein [Candidatus Omnitrophota bacterium]MCM8811315.1 competence protein ComEC family protein [Candidatus Omnitrophota bacterium]
MEVEILVLSSFILGILSSEYFPFYYIFSIIPLFFLQRINKKFIVSFLFFFILGYCLTEINKKNQKREKMESSQISFFEGEVINIKEKKFEREIKLKIKKICVGNKEVNYKGIVLLITKNQDKFLPGQTLKIKDFIISEIKPPKNPFEFNYKKFLERQGIYYIVKTNNIELIKGKKNLKILSSLIRQKLEKKISNYMKFNSDGYELVKLITIGSDDPPDFLREIGIRAGIYHLFVISGIHVLYLFLFLKILFIPFQRVNNIYPKLFPSLLLLVLWFYTFLCGFHIPVTRAVLMFSFYLIFEIFERRIEPLKSLILACFSFLFVNPYNIYSISFLLSFLSTYGIMIIPKKIHLKKNFIITSFLVTISAQLFIMPLIFYNFGYFYPMGIINNLVFTPFVGLLTINSFISIFIPIFFLPLNFASNIFLRFLTFISNVSFKTNIYFSLFSVFIYYSLLFILLSSMRKKLKIFFLLLILSFSLFQFNSNKNKNQEIIFFSTKNPYVLIVDKEKGALIVSNKIENPTFYRTTFYKILKKKKIKIEKIILIGNGFSENLFFISKYCQKIYFPETILKPSNYKNFMNYYENGHIPFSNNLVFSFKGKNLIIESNNLKILLILNEDLESSLIKDRYFLVYPIELKKNKQIINEIKSPFFIFQKKTKKFEKFKNLCQNYYLNVSTVILNLKTEKVDYWRENDNRKY